MSRPGESVLDGLGAALAYPRAGYRQALADCRLCLAAELPAAAERIDSFLVEIGELGPEELEDLYTRSFDLNPVATLEVGWHLYGEQYRRGRFLVRSRRLLSAVGIDERGELPDHLMSLLPAIARLHREEASVLAGHYLLPAIDKIVAGLAKRSNPFRHLLAAVRLALEPLAAEAGELPSRSAPSDLVQIGIGRPRIEEKGAAT